MIRLFKALPTYRKVVLFLAGGMVTLVFDAFVAHFQWNNLTMKWNQTIPVIYGLLALLVLGAVAVIPLGTRGVRAVQIMGLLGLVVGAAGMYFHGVSLLEGVDAETSGVIAFGKILASGPPLFAPAAFAGVGLLLVTLPSMLGVTGATRQPPARSAEDL